MKFSGKMYLTIILKFTKNQGFSLSLEDTLFKKVQGDGGQIDVANKSFFLFELLEYLVLVVGSPHDDALFIFDYLFKFLNGFYCVPICFTPVKFFLHVGIFIPPAFCYQLFKLLLYFLFNFFDLLNCFFNIRILHLK